MPARFGPLFAVLFLICVRSIVLAGNCGGEGVFDGSGTFFGNGLFESEAGTFEGTGVFIGSDGASFEGSGFCEFIGRVQSVEGSRINVTGNGLINGRGRFTVDGVSFDGDGEAEGDGVAFFGVGTFDGEGIVAEGGRMNVFGESFNCTGSGILAGAGSFEGEGTMRAIGRFTGRGSFNGSGSLTGTGSCEGSAVEFNQLEASSAAVPEAEEIGEEVLEADL